MMIDIILYWDIVTILTSDILLVDTSGSIFHLNRQMDSEIKWELQRYLLLPHLSLHQNKWRIPNILELQKPFRFLFWPVTTIWVLLIVEIIVWVRMSMNERDVWLRGGWSVDLYPGDRPDISKGYHRLSGESRPWLPSTVPSSHCYHAWTTLGQHLLHWFLITRKQLFFGLQTGHLSSDLYSKSGKGANSSTKSQSQHI